MELARGCSLPVLVVGMRLCSNLSWFLWLVMATLRTLHLLMDPVDLRRLCFAVASL